MPVNVYVLYIITWYGIVLINVLLIIYSSFALLQASNPYIVKLSILDDELALNVRFLLYCCCC